MPESEEIQAVRAAERERCAAIVESFIVLADDRETASLLTRIANEIRNRDE